MISPICVIFRIANPTVETAGTHLEDTIRLKCVDADLGEIARARKLAPVLRVPCTRPESGVDGLEGGERRGLEALRDVDLLEDLAEYGKVV